ncbi:PREDICTED: probable carboxylesterase 18 [Ipomoea nil]|uniref:probable carboxylesterase 18 n=1 Tax=Ipomoea nil TaxID=35883 RepID=UPI000901A328|nr:PREDICTED: probable carboxylesterase 18 [Ipomoea nil]
MADIGPTKKHPKLPCSTKLLISASSLATSICFRSDGTVNRRLLRLLCQRVSAPITTVVDGTPVSSSDVQVEASRDVWFRLFVPVVDKDEEEQQSLPLIVYFHGGGFISLSPDFKYFHNLCCRFAATVPAVVASVNYRLAPEHRYPCAYDDCFDALKFIDAKNYAVFPPITDFTRCFLAGDSAGGNIAHHITVRALNSVTDFERLNLAGQLSLQPFFGGEERTESELRLRKAPVLTLEDTDRMWRTFLPDGTNRDHAAAHVFEEELPEKFPRTLLIVGGFDLLQDWQRKYCERLRKFGVEVKVVEYPNGIHGFYSFAELPESAMLLKEIKDFMQT